MNSILQHIQGKKETVVYFAIGAAHQEAVLDDANQQMPPFLKTMILHHPNINFIIIIIDPIPRQRPVIVDDDFSIRRINNEITFFERANLTVVDIMREINIEINGDPCMRLLHNTISNSCQKKDLSETKIVLAHCFYGVDTQKLRIEIETSKAHNLNILQKNVLIDLSYGKNESCFPNMSESVFGPILYLSDEGALELFHPDNLIKPEFFQPFTSLNFKNDRLNHQIQSIPTKIMNHFTSIINPQFRQAILFMKNELNEIAPNYAASLLKNISIDFTINEIRYSGRDLTEQNRLMSELNYFTGQAIMDMFFMLQLEEFNNLNIYMADPGKDPYHLYNIVKDLLTKLNVMLSEKRADTKTMMRWRKSHIREHRTTPVWELILLYDAIKIASK